MNIFCLDECPHIAAKYHCDKHVVKMILELSQLLSTAHRVLDGKQGIRLSEAGRKIKCWKLEDSELNSSLYAATHVNHPSAIYVRSNKWAYKWTYTLLEALCTEYTYRYGKVHKCESLLDNLNNYPTNMKDNNIIAFPTPAMPTEYIVKNDIVQSYRNYYIGAKQKMASWKGKIAGRAIPDWYIKE